MVEAAKGRRETCGTTLSLDLSTNEPPTEFRIFTAGQVETSKGTFTFDDAAAKSVMADYVAHGIDLMLDYDHASLSALTLDPAQTGKAAGWFNLELRDGELWAVNVRWTPPADAALRRKEWRFMSPAFQTDDAGHITSLLNVAITNIPATRRLEPLMAASAKGGGMSVEEFLKVCKALDIDMSGSLEDAMAKIKGEKADEEPKKDEPKVEEPKPADPVATGGAPEADKPEEVAAALSAVASLSGKPSLVASVADIRTWHASHVALATERKALADREALLEGAERRKLCVELVSLGGRAPATIWADDSATKPKARYLTMPIADLREMHADEVKANSGRAAITAPATGAAPAGTTVVTLANGETRELTAREVATCLEMKVDLKDYAARTPAKKG